MKKQSMKLQVPDDVAPQVQPTKFDGVTPEMEEPEFLNAEPGNHKFYWTHGIYKGETCRE